MSIALQLLAESHVHHVYVVGLDRRPVAVLSLTDVIKGLGAICDQGVVSVAGGGGSGGGGGGDATASAT